MSVQPIPPVLRFESYEEAASKLPPESRGELIDGVWTMTPAPVPYHQRIVTRIVSAMDVYAMDNPSVGDVFASPIDVVLREDDPPRVVQPDIVFVSGDQREIIQPKAIYGAPTLVVEVVSASNLSHDTVRKRAWYSQYGVKEYWLAFPDEQRIEVLRGGELEPIATYEKEDVLESDLLPGFQLPLARVFEKTW